MRRRSACIFAILICVILAGCGTGAETPTALPTNTVPVAGGATPALPATQVATAPAEISPTPNVATPLAEAQAASDQQDYQQTVEILERLNVSHAGDPQVTNALAAAYAAWGEQIILDTQGTEERLQNAYFLFSKGLEIGPTDGAVRDKLQTDKDVTELLSRLAQQFSQATTGDAQAAATSNIEVLSQVMQTKPGFIVALPADKILELSATIGEVGDQQETFEAKVPFWTQARQVCEWVQQQFAGSAAEESAKQCIDALDTKLNPPPTPTATPKPQEKLLLVPDYHGSDVNAAEQDLRRRGFKNVAKTVDGQPGNVCKGQVTYSVPQAGRTVSANTQIRLFYRGFDSGCDG